MENKNTNQEKGSEQNIDRKEAIKKAGKYAAVTAATMLMVLNSKESSATSPGSPAPLPEW